MGVAGVPSGAPSGASAGTPAGNVAGDETKLTDADRDLSGSRGDNFGTTPVGGTVHTEHVRIGSVRFVLRGLQNKPVSVATLNVMYRPGEPDTKDLFSPGHPLGVTGGIELPQGGGAGATIETHPDRHNSLSGRSTHRFSLAQRGGTLAAGTLTTEIQINQDE